jgi:hypothetical protein
MCFRPFACLEVVVVQLIPAEIALVRPLALADWTKRLPISNISANLSLLSF